MKNIKILGSILLLFTAITFTSCENEPIDPAIDLDNFGGGNTTGVFTAKIGSENFSADATLGDYSDSTFGTELTLTGTTTSGKVIVISITNPTLGTRVASDNQSQSLLFTYFSSANDFYTNINGATTVANGSINITDFNTTTNKISGTFSFTGYGALSSSTIVEVTNGVLNNISFDNSTTGGTGGGGNPQPAQFKADFNNATWTGTQSQAIISGNLIQIASTKPDGSSFGILIDGATTGTYPANVNIISYNPPNSEFGYWSTNIDNPQENTGSITITSINTTAKTISGTFSYKGYWSDGDVTTIPPVQFTNGVFTNIPYINQDETGDTFSATVSGNNFVDVDILTGTFDINGQEWISVAAQDADLNSITVSVRSNVTVGTYTITGNVAVDSAQGVYSIDGQSPDYQSISGSVTISAKTSNHITGTFNFNGSNGTQTISITNGAFDVDY